MKMNIDHRKVKLFIAVSLLLSFLDSLKLLFIYTFTGNQYCTGTETGLNYVYLICNENIWLTISLLIDGLIILSSSILITFLLKSKRSRLFALAITLVILILSVTFYNPEAYDFWWANVTGRIPIS